MLPQTPKGILNSERDQFLVQECSRDVFAHFALKISKGRRSSGYRSRVHHLFRVSLWAPRPSAHRCFLVQAQQVNGFKAELDGRSGRRFPNHSSDDSVPIYDLSTTYLRPIVDPWIESIRSIRSIRSMRRLCIVVVPLSQACLVPSALTCSLWKISRYHQSCWWVVVFSSFFTEKHSIVG